MNAMNSRIEACRELPQGDSLEWFVHFVKDPEDELPSITLWLDAESDDLIGFVLGSPDEEEYLDSTLMVLEANTGAGLRPQRIMTDDPKLARYLSDLLAPLDIAVEEGAPASLPEGLIEDSVRDICRTMVVVDALPAERDEDMIDRVMDALYELEEVNPWKTLGTSMLMIEGLGPSDAALIIDESALSFGVVLNDEGVHSEVDLQQNFEQNSVACQFAPATFMGIEGRWPLLAHGIQGPLETSDEVELLLATIEMLLRLSSCNPLPEEGKPVELELDEFVRAPLTVRVTHASLSPARESKRKPRKRRR